VSVIETVSLADKSRSTLSVSVQDHCFHDISPDAELATDLPLHLELAALQIFDNCQHHHGPSDFESQALPIRNFRPVTRACAREAVADYHGRSRPFSDQYRARVRARVASAGRDLLARARDPQPHFSGLSAFSMSA